MITTVAIRAEGSAGYVVYMQVTGCKPIDLRRFEKQVEPGITSDAHHARKRAEQYRDGVADGIHYAAEMLQRLAGHASVFDGQAS